MNLRIGKWRLTNEPDEPHSCYDNSAQAISLLIGEVEDATDSIAVRERTTSWITSGQMDADRLDMKKELEDGRPQ
jgi:hypothetical protein